MIKVSPATRVKVLIAFMCLALLMYAVFLGRIAVLLIASGSAAAIGMGLALLIMPFLGVWAMVATLRDGFAHQRLSRLIAEDGMELDAGALPRVRPDASNGRPPTPCSTPFVPNWTRTPTTGGAGTGWPAPMSSPATVVARGRR